ncbi:MULTISPECIES: ABC transporter ATP-binding protein [Carnobacterium]|uniref:ABC transporter ATP-binding protein n=1 Tax=Carnobacterium divergens TaxID=2748 RepID=A0A7Z8CZW5_CARDV|nr:MULTISPECIES: ABC transporter ATP-binding protein [Carnobacterium]MDT1940740.1 ABC transporter ATP-binding protein [Carnobacterium divergens]MDT1943178.1 ABC transporter ATP-binding protein [Carnobacterium divergens]MDT1948985.1 ABC transporter ATP-binding protein [Carnobacterium divergens]MDT1951466.1 ABC transporter ATP-binding protein [Carnobacterium divergens]MDT1956643.1 ABC transporter ATP-binding protein [Carnobacterium divergens]
MTQLVAQNISVRIGKKDIVKDVTLRVDHQQFVGVIGANGCGKSTLLKSLYKSIKPEKGRVFLDELDVLKASNKIVAKHVSVVSQFNEMSFDLSVEQIVLLGRTPHKKLLESDTEADYQIVEQALAQTNLLQYRNRSFLSLSGGEKQRVILARAIAQQPHFIILDEPTNHLDIRYQLELLNNVKKMKIGVLAALHDLEMAASYCDYLYAMKDGEVIAKGTPEELLTGELIEELYQVQCQTFINPITKKMGFSYFSN